MSDYPCRYCNAEAMSYRDSMNATAWVICDDCREKHAFIRAALASEGEPGEPLETNENERARGPVDFLCGEV